MFFQVLKWVNQTIKERQLIAAAKLKGQQKKDAQAEGGGGRAGGGSRGGSRQPEPIMAVFTVTPPVSANDPLAVFQ